MMGRGISEKTQKFLGVVSSSKPTDSELMIPEEKKIDSGQQQALFQQSVEQDYKDRCKAIGRIGPLTTELDKLTIFGQAKIKSDVATSALYKSNCTQ